MSKNNYNNTSTRREDWGTPAGLFTLLDAAFNFKVDLAANSHNKKVDTFVTEKEDFVTNGILAVSKAAPRFRPKSQWAWCNPPYRKGGCGNWLDKLLTMPNVVILMPASVGAAWFRPVWTQATALSIIPYRLVFEGAPGNAQFDSCLIIKGKRLTKKQIKALRMVGYLFVYTDIYDTKESHHADFHTWIGDKCFD